MCGGSAYGEYKTHLESKIKKLSNYSSSNGNSSGDDPNDDSSCSDDEEGEDTLQLISKYKFRINQLHFFLAILGERNQSTWKKMQQRYDKHLVHIGKQTLFSISGTSIQMCIKFCINIVIFMIRYEPQHFEY